MHSPKKVGVLKPTTEIPVLDQNRECSSCAEAVGFIARPFASLRYHQHVTPVSDEFKVNCRYQGDFAQNSCRAGFRGSIADVTTGSLGKSSGF